MKKKALIVTKQQTPNVQLCSCLQLYSASTAHLAPAPCIVICDSWLYKYNSLNLSHN